MKSAASIRILTALILGLFLVPGYGYAKDSLQAPSFEVVIVGGGIGGLSALHELKQNQVVDVKLFEQQKRVGGRVLSVPHANELDQTFDAGAGLVDKDHFSVAELSREFRVPLLPRFLPGQNQSRVYFFNDEILTGNEIMNRHFGSDALALQRISNDQKSIRQKQFSSMTVDGYLASIGATKALKEFFTSGIESELGQSIKDLSALTLFDTFLVDVENRNIHFLHHNDESVILEGGSQRLTDRMHERHYRNIETESMLREGVENSDGSFELRIARDGKDQWVHAEKLILALPSYALEKISWKLQNNELPYAPKDLPSFAANTKVFIYFKGRPWGTEPLPPMLGTDVQGIHFQAWDGSSLNGSGGGVITLYTGVHTVEQEEQLVKNFLKQLDKLQPELSAKYLGHRSYRWARSYTTADKPGERERIQARPKRIRNLFLVGEEYDKLHQGYMEGAVRSAKQATASIRAVCKEAILLN